MKGTRGRNLEAATDTEAHGLLTLLSLYNPDHLLTVGRALPPQIIPQENATQICPQATVTEAVS